VVALLAACVPSLEPFMNKAFGAICGIARVGM
jgi:hypothetical protein